MTVFDLADLPEYEESFSTEPTFQSKLPRTEPQLTLIDTHTAMADLVEVIQSLPTSPPSLYIDLEGENLGRNGTIAIMQLHILPTNHTYLIDVQRLQHAAFTTSAHSTVITLKSILEWPGIPKVFFDVRRDSDALYHLYGVSLEGIKDLQLMEHATNPHKGHLNGLAKCIRRDANLTTSELETAEAVKQAGRKSFCPDLGGSYAAFSERPIPEHILQYCAQDAYILPLLYERYDTLIKSNRFSSGLQETVAKYEKQRIKDSQSEDFGSWGKDYFTKAPRGSEWVHPGLDDDACGAWDKPPATESKSVDTWARATLLPPSSRHYPTQLLGLQLKLDHCPRLLFRGIDQRYTYDIFSHPSQRLATSWVSLPDDLRPDSWSRWTNEQGVSLDHCIAVRFRLATPFVHSEQPVLQEIALEFTEENRAVVERETGSGKWPEDIDHFAEADRDSVRRVNGDVDAGRWTPLGLILSRDNGPFNHYL